MAAQCSHTIRQVTVVLFLLQFQRDCFNNCGVCILASEIEVTRSNDNTRDRANTQVKLAAGQCHTTLSVCQGQGTKVKVTATVETDREPPPSVDFVVSTAQGTKVIKVKKRTRRVIYKRDTGYDSTRRRRHNRDTGYDSTRRHRYYRDTGYEYTLSVDVDTYFKIGCKVRAEGIASEIGDDIVRPPSDATACDKNVTITIGCKYTQGRAEAIASETGGDIVRPPGVSTDCDNSVIIKVRDCPNNGDSKDAKCVGTTQPPPVGITTPLTTVKPTQRTTTVRQTQNTAIQHRGSSTPGQNTSSSTPHQTEAPENHDEKNMIHILAGSGVGVGVLLGCLVLCCCKRRCCCNRKPTPATDQPITTATLIQKSPDDVTLGHLMVLTPDMKSYYKVPSNHVPPGYLFVPSMDDLGFRLLPETDVPPGKRVVPQRDPPGYIIVPAPPGTGNLMAPKNYKPAKLAEEKAASVISSDSGSEDNLDVSSIISSALCNVDLESCDSLGSADSKDSKAGSVISDTSKDSKSDSDKSSDTKSVELQPPKSNV